jgi:hypothetical protein
MLRERKGGFSQRRKEEKSRRREGQAVFRSALDCEKYQRFLCDFCFLFFASLREIST